MKLHRHLVVGTLNIVQEIFSGTYADKAIEKSFKAHKQWGARDRHFVAESVYESVRWWSKIWYGLGISEDECLKEGFFKADSQNAWHMMAALLEMQDEPLPDWPEFGGYKSIKPALAKLDKKSALNFAFPTWLFQMGLDELGQAWYPIAEKLNQKATVVLRINRLKTDTKKLQQALQAEGIEAHPLAGYPDALELEKRANVFKTELFQKGHFVVQDASSQTIAPFLDPRPGERIVDACAGGGGKALHLATLMQNKGKVLALDIHDWKLQELKSRASKNGIDIIETRPIDSTKVIKRLAESAQGLLLDVPCSGLGALRRNPDSKWKLTPQNIESLKQTQSQILSDYSKMVSPRGRLVYATCSILPSENQQQVKSFIDKNQNFELIKEHWESPAQQGFDGFYMALLRKK